MKKYFALALAFAAAIYSHAALASVTPGAGWVEGVSATGQKVWFGPGTQTKLNAQMGQAIWDSVAIGARVTTTPTIYTPSGSIPVVLKQNITSASAGAAVAKFAFKIAAPLQLGMAIYDLANELGVKPSYNPTKKTNDFLDVVQSDSCPDSPVPTTNPAMCFHPNEPTGKSTSRTEYVDGVCNFYIQCSYNGTESLWSQSLPTKDSSERPLSEKEFADLIAKTSGWPTSSSIANAIRDAINDGAQLPTAPVSLTGPASVSDVPAVKTTNDGTNITTTTTTKKTTVTYNNSGTNPDTKTPVSTATGTTSTTNVNNIKNISTNTVTNTTTTTENNPSAPTLPTTPQPEPEEDLGTITDTPFGDIPKLYERKYPDGLVGVWGEKITAIKAAPLFTLVGSLMPDNIGASGSCPSFMIPVNFGQWGEYGNLDFSPPCFVWDFGKVIIIISSLLLARRLIFGG